METSQLEKKHASQLKVILEFPLSQSGRISKWINAIGLTTFFLMVCLTFVDVILRYIFNKPIMGVTEYTEVMLVLVIAFTIAYTYDKKSHVKVDIITSRLGVKSGLILEMITQIISLGLFIIIVWQCVAQLIFFIQTGNTHGSAIFIPSAPFQAALVLGSGILLLLIIRDFVRNIENGIKSKLNILSWALIAIIPIAFLALAIIWLQPGLLGVSLPIIGLIGIFSLLLLMFTGLPVAFALILSAFLMIGHIRGVNTAYNVVATEMFSTSSNYLWSVVGFFILMGYLCLYAHFGEDIYTTFDRWMGSLRGGLAMATITASTALAGIVGDSLSVTSTMGSIAFPQMRKYKYDDHLSTGTISAGATLGPLIPPSMGFIIYGTLTGESIGKLFIAGIVPGLIMAFLFILTIYAHCRINPNLAPRGPTYPIKEKVTSLKYSWPIILLFLFIVGGIYRGVFTASEGGAMGCVGALIIGLILRRFSLKSFLESLIAAGKIMGMIFLIIIAATIFSRFVAWCNLSGLIANWLTSLHWSSHALVLLILSIFFILGFFIDIMPMLLIGVPIVQPVIVSLGVDPVWFTVLLVMTIQVGVITPPFATILFALKGLLFDVPLSTIFKGVLPFVLATVGCIVVLFLVPSLVTWLPNLLYK